MKQKTDRLDFKDIDSFESLREKKREVEEEIAVAKAKVSASTDHLVQEGLKVAAAGAFAFVVSRILSFFMSSGSRGDADVSAMDSDVDKSKDEDSKTESGTDTQGKAKAEHNGQHSSMDTALLWLDTLSGGLEAAKIVLNHIVEIQEKAKEERSTEKEETET